MSESILAAAVEMARQAKPETIDWPQTWPPQICVIAALVQMCAELEEGCRAAVSQGYVRAKPSRGRPEKAQPRAVT